MQQLARYAIEEAPRPLNPMQADSVSGNINWPSALQLDTFAPARKVVDELFVQRAKYGGLTYSDQMTAKKTIDGMFDSLKAQIKTIPPQDYVECRTFLRSLIYATTKTDLPG